MEDIPKYKKKSQAKPPKKAKHKHVYEPCVLEYLVDWYIKEHERNHELKTEMGAYCPVCGKVGQADMDRWYVPKQDVRYGYIFSVWHDPSEECARELDPMTRTLPTFRIDNPFTKYVNISKV